MRTFSMTLNSGRVAIFRRLTPAIARECVVDAHRLLHAHLIASYRVTED